MAAIKQLVLKNKFNKEDLSTYDTNTLEVVVTLFSAQAYKVEQVGFMITLLDVNAASYWDEEDIDFYEEVLMYVTNNEQQQQEDIDAQFEQLPFEFTKEQTFDLKLRLVGSNSGHENLLDIIKTALHGGYNLNSEKQLELQISTHLNYGQKKEVSLGTSILIDNPFFGA